MGGAESYDCEKACSSINHSILSALRCASSDFKRTANLRGVGGGGGVLVLKHGSDDKTATSGLRNNQFKVLFLNRESGFHKDDMHHISAAARWGEGGEARGAKYYRCRVSTFFNKSCEFCFKKYDDYKQALA